MLIDWFTVIAQAVNFLVLMFLLKRFLYRPVLNAIDEREARIAKTVKAADDQMKTAEAERKAYADKNEEFDRQRVEMIGRARDDAKKLGDQFLEKEKAKVAAMRDQWQDALTDERRRFADQASHRIQDEVFATTRRVLSDLADTSLEERMVGAFDRRLRAGDFKLGPAPTEGAASVRVKSAFDLSEEQQSELRQTLANLLGDKAGITFETAPDLVGGIELIVDGQKLAWTVDDYLTRLKESLAGSIA